MNKVNLFIVGAQKCGTTTLASWLKNHHDVSVLHIKESQLFSWQLDENPNMDIKAYHDWEFKKNAKIMVDASTTYTFYNVSERVAKRIFEYNKDAKIIYLVKNPIDRVHSHYVHQLLRGKKMLPIEEEVLQDSLIGNSSYYSCIIPFYKIFPEKQILTIEMTDLLTLKTSFRKKLEQFLEINLSDLPIMPNANRGVENSVSTYQYITYKKLFLRFFPDRFQIYIKRKFFLNRLKEKPELSESTREKIKLILADEMEMFYSLTGIDYR